MRRDSGHGSRGKKRLREGKVFFASCVASAVAVIFPVAAFAGCNLHRVPEPSTALLLAGALAGLVTIKGLRKG